MPASSAPQGGPQPPNDLLERLADRAEPDGFVPFDRFMDVALYGPGVGYYGRAQTPFGPSGDFYTAPSVHPLFARTLARRVEQVARSLGAARPLSLVDLGCGDGTLLAGLAAVLEERSRGLRLRYVAVDRSEARRATALAELRRRLPGEPYRALSGASLAELGPIEGVVLAHELLDAQPARRWRWDGARWREMGLRLQNGALVEAERDGGRGPDPPLPALGTDRTGTLAETSSAAEALVREIADHLTDGLLVVVDFGAEENELLGGHPHGTLAAVRSHRALASPLEAPGQVDLSAFVNFTRLREAARRAGLVEVANRSQAEALGAWGFASELDEALQASGSSEAEVRVRLAAKNLLFGFGSFRVLELAAPSVRPSGNGASGPSLPARW
jgi:SAM-dependent MidA family methyltransferase